MPSLFTKIINREIAADIVHEDEVCFAIRDINPQAPHHLLVIPRKEIRAVDKSSPDDAQILGHVLVVAGELARKLGVVDSGYRLVINAGEHAGQTVPHLHVHLLAGRALSWPPG
jgi:histidine triad (HIT) family protein